MVLPCYSGAWWVSPLVLPVACLEFWLQLWAVLAHVLLVVVIADGVVAQYLRLVHSSPEIGASFLCVAVCHLRLQWLDAEFESWKTSGGYRAGLG